MIKVKRFLFLKFDAKLSILEKIYTTNNSDKITKASSIEPKVSSVAQDEKIAAEFVASNHADPTESVETSLLKVRGYIQHTWCWV